MKRVKFDNSLSLQLAYGDRKMPPVLKLEGWLVDSHVCVQMPNLEIGSGWRVSLYPWGHAISFDFYIKSDAVKFAEDVSKLEVDWKYIHSVKPIGRSAGLPNVKARLLYSER